VIEAFNSHDIVRLGEWHADKQEHTWLRQLIGTPEFADRVDDIVMEFGNSLYQKSVDRYVAGEDVPLEQVEKAWRNTVASVGAPSPVYELLYKAVRETRAERQPWLVIDPKSFVGDPAYDGNQHLFNCSARLQSHPDETIRRLADLLGVDYGRLQLWTFARAAAEPRDNWSNREWMDLARRIAP
jgi:Aminoglycoside/hydroxyurea antibiotic resistance kinase